MIIAFRWFAKKLVEHRHDNRKATTLAKNALYAQTPALHFGDLLSKN
jgi:hypothetical protein